MFKKSSPLILLIFIYSCKSSISIEPKIIYSRIENYVTVKTPKSDSIIVRDQGKIITPIEGNKYPIEYKDTKDNKKNIEIVNYLKNDKIDSINYTLKTKNLKCYPNYKINGIDINSGIIIKKTQFKNAVLKAYFNDFIYNKLVKINHFKAKIHGFSTILVKGNKINDEVYNIIQSLKKEEYIDLLIFDISFNVENMKWKPSLCTPPTLFIKIKNNR